MNQQKFAESLENRPFWQIAYGGLIAVAADELYEGIVMFSSNQAQPARVPDPPPLADWWAMYADENRVWDDAGVMLGMPESGPESASQVAKWIRKFVNLPPRVRARILSRCPREDLTPFAIPFLTPKQVKFHGAAGTFEEAIQEIFPDDLVAKNVHRAGVQFLLRVGLPCYLSYGKHPKELLHSAASGDLDALDDLLRIDKSVLAEPSIASRWHAAMHGRNRAIRRRLLAAVEGRPRGGITRKKVKSWLAGLLSQVTSIGGESMDEPQIRGFFDRISQENGRLRDPDLPCGSDTLSKAIHRNRRYPDFPKPDKNRP